MSNIRGWVEIDGEDEGRDLAQHCESFEWSEPEQQHDEADGLIGLHAEAAGAHQKVPTIASTASHGNPCC